jgi:ferrochelatase
VAEPGTSRPVGVLVMAYGSPSSPAGVEAYYTHVRGGRPPTRELLEDLQRRYRAIGGTSPLGERTGAQVEGLRAELGQGFVVTLGLKHVPPFIEDGMAILVAAGAEHVVGLVLAPHASSLSVGQYHERARAARRRARYTPVPSWHRHDTLVDLLAERVLEGLHQFPAGADVETLFTAHALPARVLGLDEPSYPYQLRETAEAVAARAGLTRWRLAWQSAGRTPEPWLGPDILEVVPRLAEEGAAGVLVCPAGFVSDHLEVLYDIDVEARGVAERAGLRLVRTRSLNDDPRFVGMLADIVRTTSGAPVSR